MKWLDLEKNEQVKGLQVHQWIRRAGLGVAPHGGSGSAEPIPYPSLRDFLKILNMIV